MLDMKSSTKLGSKEDQNKRFVKAISYKCKYMF